MTYQEIIEEVKELYPSEYDTTELKRFLQEAESGIGMYIDNTERIIEDLDDTAILPLPFCNAYIDFIRANICYNQHDDEGYRRYISMYNAKFDEFKRWYVRSHEGKTVKYKNWI